MTMKAIMVKAMMVKAMMVKAMMVKAMTVKLSKQSRILIILVRIAMPTANLAPITRLTSRLGFTSVQAPPTSDFEPYFLLLNEE